MKKENHLPPLSFFRDKLLRFIQERHPGLADATDLIRLRAEKALMAYADASDAGYRPEQAIRQADAILYEGLLFSKFDTIRCILLTEYPYRSPLPDSGLWLSCCNPSAKIYSPGTTSLTKFWDSPYSIT